MTQYRPVPRIVRAIQAQYPTLRGDDAYTGRLVAEYRRMRDAGCSCEDCLGVMQEYRRRIEQCVRLRHFIDPADELVISMHDLGLTMN